MRRLFICHATEDKEAVARPLALDLRRQGFEVWYDEYSLRMGDSLRREIERGIRDCDFGVVVLSRAFFQKEWPQRELDALTAKEIGTRSNVILPVWHELELQDILRLAPALADRVAVSTRKGITDLSEAIVKAALGRTENVLHRYVSADTSSETSQVVTGQGRLAVAEPKPRFSELPRSKSRNVPGFRWQGSGEVDEEGFELEIRFDAVFSSKPRSLVRDAFESEVDRRSSELICPRHSRRLWNGKRSFGAQINTLKMDMTETDTSVWGWACCRRLIDSVKEIIESAQRQADA